MSPARHASTARVYAALGSALCEPTAALLDRHPSNPLLAALGKAMVNEELGATFEAAFESLWQALDESESVEDRLEKMQIEYARLFLAPPRPLLSPYERTYRGTTASHADAEILEAYRAFGLTVHPDHRDLPDHIALELELMAHLRERGMDAESTEFLTNQLSSFALRFATDLRAATTSPIYRAIADSLEALIRSDVEFAESTHATAGNNHE